MKALHFHKKLRLVDAQSPRKKSGEVIVKVDRVGICNTDHEILKGYVPGFNGILGHEFIGHLADEPKKRVTAEINCACGNCSSCRSGMSRHCPRRSVLGIIARDGAMAEYLRVPRENLVSIPRAVRDEQAVFIEPLAAACAIFEQVKVTNTSQILVIGDGKLATLIALVCHHQSGHLTVLGKHSNKLKRISRLGPKNTKLLKDFKPGKYDLVIEASGNPKAFDLALQCTRPRGKLVLKSTYAGSLNFNPMPLVVDEISLVGSRCGRFQDAIRFIKKHDPALETLIDAVYPIDQGLKAFRHSSKPAVQKVLIET